MVREHQLRLDRRVVADCDYAIRLALPQCLGRLDHRQRATGAVIGDAGVGAFEVVFDADVTEDVVGQRAQEPHRIDRAAEVTAEGFEIAVRLAHQGEILVLRVVGAAAGADIDAAPIGKRRRVCFVQPVAARSEARAVDGAAGRIKAEHVAAADQLVQLPVLDQGARIEIRHLGRHRYRPPGRVPLLQWTDRRAPLAQRGEDFPGIHSRRANCAGAGDEDLGPGHDRCGAISRASRLQPDRDAATARSCSIRQSRTNWKASSEPAACARRRRQS